LCVGGNVVVVGVVVVVVVVVAVGVVVVVETVGVGPPLAAPAGTASATVANVTAPTNAALTHSRLLTAPPS
jgi:hypothetical protein